MLMVMITILNVAVAASLPLWSTQIQRDKEEELISRGWQYVEAIRVFQNRFQRLPVRLEELIEVKPRCIRRLWKDPMTDGGKFMPVFQNQGVPLQAQPDPEGRQGKEDPNADSSGNEGEGSETGEIPFGGKDPNAVAVGPIVGVRSRSHKKSILVLFGREKYDEWQFSLESLLGGQRSIQGGGAQVGGANPVSNPAPGATISLSTRWIGRPLPSIFQPPAGTMPGGEDQNPDALAPRGKPPAGQPPRGRVPRP